MTAFLISTPQTGVDSIAVTYALLGPVFAVFRPVAALISGNFGGVLVVLLGESKQEQCRRRGRPAPLHRSRAAAQPGRGPPCSAPWATAWSPLPATSAGALLPGRPHRRPPWASWRLRRIGACNLGGGIGSILLLMAAGVPGLRLRHRLGAHRRLVSSTSAPRPAPPWPSSSPARPPTPPPSPPSRKCSAAAAHFVYLLSVAVSAVGFAAAAGPTLRLPRLDAAPQLGCSRSCPSSRPSGSRPSGPSPCWPCWPSPTSRCVGGRSLAPQHKLAEECHHHEEPHHDNHCCHEA